MKRILKFALEEVLAQTVELPRGAQILKVSTQQGKLRLWAVCDETAPLEPRSMAIYATGETVPDDPGQFLDTLFVNQGRIVCHVFETTGVKT